MLIYARQFRRKCRQGAAVLGIFAHFRTQVGVHNCLPCLTRGRLLSDTDQGINDFSETLFQGLNEQLVLAGEMFVKPSMSQTSVAHYSNNSRSVQALGADAL